LVSEVAFSEDHRNAIDAVRELYDGAEGALFGLIFGEQIHLGGFNASTTLADDAGIRGGSGVDLCCGYGAGMRLLSRYRDVESMIGIDISPEVQNVGRQRCVEDGITNIEFRCEDACATSIASSSVDFVWSEDAWCYVPDKDLLIGEAVRIVKPGGAIAFTDWVEGSDLAAGEREFLMAGMRFPGLETMDGYVGLLQSAGCDVVHAQDTGTFNLHLKVIADMLDTQLRWDALRKVSFDAAQVDLIVDGLKLIAEWGNLGKVLQARIVARKK
tara:strand:+ start:217 stop:1029 length:813 start_codon:yes stop_codon:yes gene_type:complete